MKIGIIGAGNIGSALAQKLIGKGHTILIGAKFPLSPNSLKLASLIGKDRFTTTNAFGKPLTGYDSTVAAIKNLTDNPDVVKCFNSIGAEDLANPQFGSMNADTFVAGNSKHAKDITLRLALDMGFENCYDDGGEEGTSLLENLAVLWGALAYKTGLGRRIAFKVLKD